MLWRLLPGVPVLIYAISYIMGYNASSRAAYALGDLNVEEKQKINQVALCRFVGWSIIIRTMFFVLFIIGNELRITWLAVAGAIITLLSFPAYWFYIDKYVRFGSHFRK